VRGPLIFTPLPRLLHLEAMIPGLKNGVEVCLADMSWGGWVLPIVLRDKVRCFDIGGHLPSVRATGVKLQEIPQLIIIHGI